MGFAIMPQEPKLGVYVLKETGDLVLVVGAWFGALDVIYKPRQRRSRTMKPSLMTRLKYIGEFE